MDVFIISVISVSLLFSVFGGLMCLYYWIKVKVHQRQLNKITKYDYSPYYYEIKNLNSEIRVLKYKLNCKDKFTESLKNALHESEKNRTLKANRINEEMAKNHDLIIRCGELKSNNMKLIYRNGSLLNRVDCLEISNESLLSELKTLQLENAKLIAKCVKLDSYNNELSLGVNLYIDELAEFRKVKIGWNYFEKDVNGKMKIFIKPKKRKS